jgi:hypothetical protein
LASQGLIQVACLFLGNGGALTTCFNNFSNSRFVSSGFEI